MVTKTEILILEGIRELLSTQNTFSDKTNSNSLIDRINETLNPTKHEKEYEESFKDSH